jgi:predicted CXXCH cytochrome family protein
MFTQKPGAIYVAAIILILIVGFVNSCASPGGGTAATDNRSHSGCFLCHRAAEPESAGPYGFALGIEPSSVCMDCHHYERDHHPVNFTPPAFDLVSTSRSGLPLFEGRLQCLTCHEAHRGKSLSNVPGLLRGGPYEDGRDLCFICHFMERYAEINPHKMLDGGGNIRLVDDKPVCTLCHDGIPDVLDHSSGMSFRADIAFLCRRCHPPKTGTFMDSHFHVVPSHETRKNMEKTHNVREVLLPLAADGMITCSTCHNPHEKGMLESPVNTGADAPARLRMAKRALCLSCHAM